MDYSRKAPFKSFIRSNSPQQWAVWVIIAIHGRTAQSHVPALWNEGRQFNWKCKLRSHVRPLWIEVNSEGAAGIFLAMRAFDSE